MLEIKTGPCRGSFEKWGFDRDTRRCIQFSYGGCRGNRNNFDSYHSCNETCNAGIF